MWDTQSIALLIALVVLFIMFILKIITNRNTKLLEHKIATILLSKEKINIVALTSCLGYTPSNLSDVLSLMEYEGLLLSSKGLLSLTEKGRVWITPPPPKTVEPAETPTFNEKEFVRKK